MRKRFIAMIAAGCSSAAIAGEPGWTVSETSGPVQIGHGGLSKVAMRGLGVAAGDTVTTGPGGRAVLVRGSEYMMVAAASRLRLPSEVQATGFTLVVQEVGNVVFMIKKKMTPHFEVKTPYLAAVVKGTTFSVGVTDKGALVQVLEGAVDVATGDGGAHDLLKPGSVATVGAQDLYRMRVETNGVTRVVASPSAPASDPTPASVTRNGATSPVATAALNMPLAESPQIAVAKPVIDTAVYEAPVSLASVISGLVSGTTGGGADIAELASMTRTVTEASTSAIKAVESANAAISASTAAAMASQAATNQAQAAELAAQTRTASDQAAQMAALAAQQAAEAAAKATSEKASSEAAAAAAKATAEATAQSAAAAAAAAGKAQSDIAATSAVQAAAQLAADQAAKAAAQAALQAANAAGDVAAQAAAQKAAADAAKASDDVAKANAAAAQAAMDKAAKDAAKNASDQAAAKAAQEAAKAASDAAKAAADQTAKQADDAAKAAEKAAKDAAKQQEDAAKAAAKAADDAAKAAAAATAASSAQNAVGGVVSTALQLLTGILKGK